MRCKSTNTLLSIEEQQQLEQSNFIEGLTASEQRDIVEYVAQSLFVDAFEEGKKTALDIKTELLQYSADFIKEQTDALSTIKELAENNPMFFEGANALEESISKAQAVIDNIDKILGFSREYLNQLEGVQVTKVEEITSEEVLNEENEEDVTEQDEAGLERTTFSDNFSLELNSKDTVSGRLRKYLSVIKDADYDTEGNRMEKKNFLDLPKYKSYDDVSNELHRILVGLPADSNEIMQALEDEATLSDNTRNRNNAWLRNFIEAHKDFPENIKKEFVVEMTKHQVKMKFVMYNRFKTKVGWETRLSIFDDNSSSVTRRILRNWKNKHLTSDLIDENGFYKEDKVKGLKDLADKIPVRVKKDHIPDVKKLLNDLGLDVNENFLNAVFYSGFTFYKDGQRIKGSDLTKRDGWLDTFVKMIDVAQKSKVPANQLNFTNDSMIYALAKGSSKFETDQFDSSFRVGDKIISTYVMNQYLTDRVREVKNNEGGIREKLENTYFSQNSLWLNLLQADENTKKIFDFNNVFDYEYISLNPLKKAKGRRTDKITKTGFLDVEVTKLGHFFGAGKAYTDIEIAGQNVKIRKAVNFTPTHSDKGRSMAIQGIAIEATDKQEKITSQALDVFIDTVVQSELTRINKTSNPAIQEAINLKSYNGSLFYLMPELNEVMITFNGEQKTLREVALITDVLSDSQRSELRKQLDNIFKNKIADKLAIWEDIQVIEKKNNQYQSKFLPNVLDSNNTALSIERKAAEYVFNDFLAKANMFQMLIGDPAQYFKSRSKNPIDQAYDTYDNIFKRAAAEIAPGLSFEGENYIQLFASDVETGSMVQGYFDNLFKNNPEAKKAYSKFSHTDAQEYTTWKEHLGILRDLGRITKEEYDEASKAFKAEELPNTELFNKVLQPLKPVYVYNNLEQVGDIHFDKKYYIKSSSFPLIPALTKGLDIDTLRQKMEAKEKETGMPVRFAYSTAVKVGMPKESISLYDSETGEFNSNIEITGKNSTVLPRKGFKIQQDVPYKETKTEINKGSQIEKLIWANLISEPKFKALQSEYLSLFEELYKLGLGDLRQELFTEGRVDNNKLSKLLEKELKTRGEATPALLDGLKTDSNGNFLVPLWLSAYADKYNAMINSVVAKRVVKHKMNGGSYVLGSPWGFRKTEVKEGEDANEFIRKTNGIIFTDSFDATKGLLPQRVENGKVKPAQVMLPFKFKDSTGNPLMIEDFIEEVDGVKRLDLTKIDPEILKGIGFRIPTQLHSSMSYVEIVGFLPKSSGDLVLAPAEFTVQMGSDFDVDKLYAYLYATEFADGRIQKITGNIAASKLSYAEAQEIVKEEAAKYEAVKESIDPELETIQEIVDYHLNNGRTVDWILNDLSIVSNVPVEKITGYVNTLNIRYNTKKSAEAIVKNRLLDIRLEVLSSPEAQAMIAAPLGFGKFMDAEDNVVDNIRQLEVKKKRSLIDDDYHTEKFYEGVAGKDGIGMFSSDSIMNVLMQDKGIVFTEVQVTPDGTRRVPITVKFGNKYNESTGELGRIKSLKKEGARNITEVIAAAQNLSVDNANANGMHYVNMNSFTFGAYTVLNFLGFEEEISGYFMAQPILKEYVKEMRKTSILLPFESTEAKHNRVINELLVKYGFNSQEEVDIDLADFNGKDAEKELKNLIEQEGSNEKSFKEMQAAILLKFNKLREYSNAFSPIRKLLNVDSKGFRKGMYSNRQMISDVYNLYKSPLRGIEQLIGEYDVMKDEGGNVIAVNITPNTLAGYDQIYGTQQLTNYFGQHFIDGNSSLGFDSVVAEIASIQEKTSITEFTVKEVKKHYKDFLLTRLRTADNTKELRSSLLTDTEENSLYSNLLKLKETNYGKENRFLNSIEVEKTAEGLVDIRFNNASRDNFDTSEYYNSFIDLFRQVENINDINVAVLAEQLVYYALLKGGNISSQFIKFIPPVIMNKVLNTGIVNEEEQRKAKKLFVDQYIRHNSSTVPSSQENYFNVITVVSEKDQTPFKLALKKEYLSSVTSDYITLRRGDEDILYKKRIADEEGNIEYIQINKLGNDFITEYSVDSIVGESIVKENNKSTEKHFTRYFGEEYSFEQQNEPVEKTDTKQKAVEYDTTSVKSLLGSVKGSVSGLAQMLSDYVDDNVKLEVVPGDVSSYDSTNNVIKIGENVLKNRKVADPIIVHEVMHAVTTFVVRNRALATPEQLEAIERLEAFQNGLYTKFNAKEKEHHDIVLMNYLLGEYNRVQHSKINLILEGKYRVTQRVNELAEILNRYNEDVNSVTQEEFDLIEQAKEYQFRVVDSAYYGMLNLEEFIAVSSSDKHAMNFYEAISGGKYIEAIKTFFAKILETLGFRNSEVVKGIMTDVFTIMKTEPDTESKVLVDIEVDALAEAKRTNSIVELNGENVYMVGSKMFTDKGNEILDVNDLPFLTADLDYYVKQLVEKGTLVVDENSINRTDNPLTFTIEGERYVSLKQYYTKVSDKEKQKAATIAAYTQNPKEAAAYILYGNNEGLVNELRKTFGLIPKTTVTIQSDKGTYSLSNLPSQMVNPVSLKTTNKVESDELNAAKYANKMIGFGDDTLINDFKEAFNSRPDNNDRQALDEMMSPAEIQELRKEGIDMIKKCEGTAAAGRKPEKFRKGGEWTLVEDLKGPSHSGGGVDITITNGGTVFNHKGQQYRAENGLVTPYTNVWEEYIPGYNLRAENGYFVPLSVDRKARAMKLLDKFYK